MHLPAQKTTGYRNEALLATAGNLQLLVDHAVCGVLPGFSGRQRHHNNVLYLTGDVGADGDGGELVWFDDAGDERVFAIEPWHIYFFSTGTEKHYRFGKGLEIAAFHFGLEVIPGFDLFQEQRMGCMCSDCREVCQTMFDLMINTKSFRETIAISGLILDIASGFAESSPEALKRAVLLREQYGPALVGVDQITADIRVAIMADSLGLNRDTFSKAFKRDMGVSPKAYLSRLLARRACSLLTRSDACIHEIAAKLRFSTEFYFSRFIKQMTGMSPTEYRQKNSW